MRKQFLLALMLSAALGAASLTAAAQDNGSSTEQTAQSGERAEHGHGGRYFDPAKRTEMLTKRLNLTSDQHAKVLEILKSEQSQMENLRSDTSLSQEDRRSKMMDIHKTSNDQIRGLLDATQQKKWDEMQSRREQWQEHHNGGPGSGTPNSSN